MKRTVKDLVSELAVQAVEAGELAPDTPLISLPKKVKGKKRKINPKVSKVRRGRS